MTSAKTTNDRGAEVRGKLKSLTWKELEDMNPEQRRVKWIEFRTAFPEHAEMWEDTQACEEAECNRHDDGWCNYADFPCGYNPFLTPRTGYAGMACMGLVPDPVLQEFEEDA